MTYIYIVCPRVYHFKKGNRNRFYYLYNAEKVLCPGHHSDSCFKIIRIYVFPNFHDLYFFKKRDCFLGNSKSGFFRHLNSLLHEYPWGRHKYVSSLSFTVQKVQQTGFSSFSWQLNYEVEHRIPNSRENNALFQLRMHRL